MSLLFRQCCSDISLCENWKWNKQCFKLLLCTVKVELSQGELGLIRSFFMIFPQSSINRSTPSFFVTQVIFIAFLTPSINLNFTLLFSSEWSDLAFGVPKGSVLGLIEFYMYALLLGAFLRHYNIQYHIYADHTQLYCSFDVYIPWIMFVVPFLNVYLIWDHGW